jgi:hypothetical protein
MAPGSLPERRPREQCAMTACPEEESKVFELRSEKPRGQPQVATKKLNGFAKWGTRLLTWIWLSLTSSLIVVFSVSECY